MILLVSGVFPTAGFSGWKTIAFVVTWQLKEENKAASNIYLVPTNEGEVRQLTNAKGTNVNPRWMPDGKTIAFISTRDGESQIWTIPVSGGEAKKVSHIATEASNMTISPDGRWFAFTSDVFPDCLDEDCNAKKMESIEKSKIRRRSLQLFRIVSGIIGRMENEVTCLLCLQAAARLWI